MAALAENLSGKLAAMRHCAKGGSLAWERQHAEDLARLQRDNLPHGSGIDGSYTPMDLDGSTPERLVFNVDYHAMDEHGGYCGWFRYTAIATPSFSGVSVSVRRRQRKSRSFDDEGALEWIAETFQHALSQPAERPVSSD